MVISEVSIGIFDVEEKELREALEAGSHIEQQGIGGETAYSLYVRVAAEAHSRVSV